MMTATQLEKDFTKHIMGYSALGIVLSTCLGSIAIFQILAHGNNFVQMTLVLAVVMVCSLHNAAILTVQPAKLIFKLLVLSVVVNSLILITSLLV